MEKIYQSKRGLQKKSVGILRQYLLDFLKLHCFVRCKALKNRKIFFDKLPKVIFERRDSKSRLECFWVAIDILKKSVYVTSRAQANKKEYEIYGLSLEGKRVFIHFREEVTRKDKRLFLISTYYKDKD